VARFATRSLVFFALVADVDLQCLLEMKSNLKHWIQIGLFILMLFESRLVEARSTDWVTLARRLTGESETIRQRSLKQLGAIKNLDSILTDEIHQPTMLNGHLNTRKFLAFDVIVALQRRSMMPVLVKESLTDEAGATYHTMNALLTSENGPAQIRLYHARLVSHPNSDAVQITLLDTLGRSGFELSLSEVRRLNTAGSIEVKAGLLSYLREMMILKNHQQYQELLPELMNENSYELKMQTLFLAEELMNQKKLNLKETRWGCLKDSDMKIQIRCKKIAGMG
jgi:hypothetical protein